MTYFSALLLSAAMGLPAPAEGRASVMIPECLPAVDLPDADHDGLSDACELALATQFAPVLLVRAGGCNWDAGSARLAGGYVHAAAPTDNGARISYLPAYFVDCGWRDVRCVLPFVDCAPHAGDSEFIVVDVARSGGAEWRASGVFLSAHCFGRKPGSCRWYRDRDLDRFGWYGAAPMVWVAEGRNANYPTWQACNAGHRRMDTCARNDVSYRFPVQANRNIGSRTHPGLSGGCLSGRELASSLVDANRVECFWDVEARFRGWQPSGPGVTPYERYLREIAGA